MKILKFAILALVVTFMSCNEDNDSNYTSEVVLSETEIPTVIKSYVSTHFPSNTIDLASKKTENNTVTYKLSLSENLNLKFNNSYSIINIDGMSQLPDSVIPQSILDYVTENYPNNYITDWEIEDEHQEIELDNDVELEFTLDGVFIRVDNDDNENETILSNSEVPMAIKDFILAHFPSNIIIKAVKDTEGTTITYDIDLNGNIELEFNSLFGIISIESTTQLPDSVIPQALLDYVAQNYPINYITDWELETNHQQIELDNSLELEFTLDGVFIRIDND